MEKTTTTLFPCRACNKWKQLYLFLFFCLYFLVARNKGKQLYLFNNLAAAILQSCQEGKLFSLLIFGLGTFSFAFSLSTFWMKVLTLKNLTYFKVKLAKYEDLQRGHRPVAGDSLAMDIFWLVVTEKICRCSLKVRRSKVCVLTDFRATVTFSYGNWTRAELFDW